MSITFSLLTGAALVTGLAAGVIAGMLGVGGGIVIVPALLYLFHYDGVNPALAMPLAVGTSLASIVITNIIATWSHHRRGSVRWDVARDFIPGILLGSWLGAWLAVYMTGEVLRLLFGVFEVAVGVHMLRGGARPEGDGARRLAPTAESALALGIGGVSSMFGIGGGTLSVPVLSLLSGLTMRQAVATSSAMGVAIALAGAMGFIQAGWDDSGLPYDALGYVVPPAFLGLVVGTMITTPLGVRLAHALPASQLRRWFGLFLVVVGIKLIWM